jgi:hypothetical protein
MVYNIFPKNDDRTNIGVMLVVVLLAVLVNVKPNYFKFLFKSILGNLILAFVIIVIGIFDVKWGIGFAAVAFIIYQAFKISCIEGFASSSNTGVRSDGGSVWGLFPEGYPIPKTMVWPQSVIQEFVAFQKIHNPNLRFDLDIIQTQASAEDAKTLLKTGKWPWSPDVITLYKNAISQNNIINNEPGASLENAQSVYNQTAIVELLAWNTKEGSFLLNGAIIKHTDGMPDNINNLVRCGKDSASGAISMQKVLYTGYNGVNGSLVSNVKPIANEDIPKEVNGFKFLNSSACNPCGAIDDPADYSCPFSLNVGDGAQVSNVWQQLWGLNSSGNTVNGGKKTDVLTPETVATSFNKKDFPILSQLSEELMKGVSYVNVSFKKPGDLDASSISGSGQNIGSVSGSSVPAIITNGSRDDKIYYGTKNSF